MRTTVALVLLASPLLGLAGIITPSPTIGDIITVCNPFTSTVTVTQPAFPCAALGDPCTTFGADPCCGDRSLHCQAISIPGTEYEAFGVGGIPSNLRD
ncbi:hypothetical protein EVG20_g9961 [Dentipellis fragilis]|uniref:Hydrophobin n=1 Tax=Dentipellis fragilis TaxID=205917 RepID=A0A4Y9XUI2_9AGAM|nr:hypothetical protein EVG20_g9961 [Dentipellis fragilis]